MDKETLERLLAAGFRIGDAEDFLELNEEEREILEQRLEKVRREEQGRVDQ